MGDSATAALLALLFFAIPTLLAILHFYFVLLAGAQEMNKLERDTAPFGVNSLNGLSYKMIFDTLVALSQKAEIARPIIEYTSDETIGVLFTGTRGSLDGRSVIFINEQNFFDLSYEERTVALAHEIAHIKHGDVINRFYCVSAIWGLRLSVRISLLLAFIYGVFISPEIASIPSIAFGAYALLHGIAFYAYSILCRHQEFSADRLSAELTGDRQGVIRALRHIQLLKDGSVLIAKREKWSSKIIVVILLRVFGILKFFASHPTIEKRIERLEQGEA